MQEFVVAPSEAAIAHNRDFWGGRAGLAVLLVPGAAIAVLGLVMTILTGRGWNLFFGAVVIASGLLGVWSGWLTHVRDRDRSHEATWLFRLDREGVHFPRQHPTDWADARFVLAEGNDPRLLVSPQGYAFGLDRLACSPDDLGAAIAELSGGSAALTRTHA